MRMFLRTRRKIHSRAARRRPRPQGAGHGRRGPRPLLPPGNAGPRPLLPGGNAGPPPASASAPPPHGGHPAVRPPNGGHSRRGGRTAPAFCAPHAVVGAVLIAGFSQLPPAPRPQGRGEREVTTACGRGRGLLTSARVLLLAKPLPDRQSDALGIQGGIGFCASPRLPS